MSDDLTKLQTRLGHVFRDPALLELALTHTSFAAERPGTDNNQRLEFLGDAVLQILLAEALFRAYPDDREGELSRRRALLVNRSFLAGLAREVGLDRCLRLGRSELQAGGRGRTSALGDAFESVIGALYLDSDFDTTRRAVLGVYGNLAERLHTTERDDNPKGRLQERVQPLHGNSALRYELLATTGADHAREYEVAVLLHDRRLGVGRGTSKKLAEEEAAREALRQL